MKRALATMAVIAMGGLLGGCASHRIRTVLPAAVRDSCWAELAQPSIGQKADRQIGLRLVHDTGARELRWVPERATLPADTRYGRITVSYDEDLRITRVSCG